MPDLIHGKVDSIYLRWVEINLKPSSKLFNVFFLNWGFGNGICAITEIIRILQGKILKFFKVKGSVREKLKGVSVIVVLNSTSIATNFTSICWRIFKWFSIYGVACRFTIRYPSNLYLNSDNHHLRICKKKFKLISWYSDSRKNSGIGSRLLGLSYDFK